MGIIQPNIDSIKSISGSDCISSSIPPKSSINYRNFSRPLNLRIRNMQMGNKWFILTCLISQFKISDSHLNFIDMSGFFAKKKNTENIYEHSLSLW